MMRRILIANRGEIAVRIIRACRDLGLTAIAVYSEADRAALHVQMADEAYCIGPAPAHESYLNIKNILTVAIEKNVDAIHPGYGFLAENANFASLCEKENIKFIGPSAHVIERMGDKAEARKTVASQGVPTIPGSPDIVPTVEEALDIAKQYGYPVMIKATAGGGGKGMRVAHDAKEMKTAFQQATREAEAAFGNGAVYIEKFIVAPRHIEVQIAQDQHGQAVHFGERDCSVQRRHQKLIEEAPSPFVDDVLRDKMGVAAVQVALAVGYEGVGTVEFLVDADKNFYFMEMNTRIQVEHPITEEVTSVDLVKEQFTIARGDQLSVKQEEIQMTGWAMECRINAEDVDKDFQPSPGTITSLLAPGGIGVRLDSAAHMHSVISPYYDSMIAKLIVTGKTREETLIRLERALREFQIEGVKTTIPFHLAFLQREAFRQGNYDTSILE